MEFDAIYQGLITGEEKLALVGLGYVGMPLAVEFAKHVPVIGFDINEKRVNEYANGIDATNEVGEAIKNTTVSLRRTLPPEGIEVPDRRRAHAGQSGQHAGSASHRGRVPYRGPEPHPRQHRGL